jgi:hypothetical protein
VTRVELHIERLILDGIALGPAGERELQGALQARLTDLFGEAGPGVRVGGGSVARMRAAPMALAGDDPATLGSRLADVVYTSLPGGAER